MAIYGHLYQNDRLVNEKKYEIVHKGIMITVQIEMRSSGYYPTEKFFIYESQGVIFEKLC